jgi:pimeloyl-ACP methyl ester carboxylesterase
MTHTQIAQLSMAALLVASFSGALRAQTSSAKPTIVLVHGAFADGSSWELVIPILQRDGYR